MTSNLQLQKQDELKAFLKAAGNKLVVIEFSAKWCGPCKRIYPVFHNKLPPILQSYYQKKSYYHLCKAEINIHIYIYTPGLPRWLRQ
ncbi:hypothetical protein FD754_017848 [Muntiacus muntjak]|uniref:Thioredoxin domain-containing protein n=1 Tax=Muntiacus muntjak TaxID=9888 RepID=A0A5N3VUP7_MUNMU|nr:hypothetical protein FD754_017848 [Muntiacus muntjak]